MTFQSSSAVSTGRSTANGCAAGDKTDSLAPISATKDRSGHAVAPARPLSPRARFIALRALAASGSADPMPGISPLPRRWHF
jgi:hypothetical protein